MPKISRKLQEKVAAELREIDIHDEFIETYFNIEGDQCLILISGEEGLRRTEIRAVYKDGMVLKTEADSWEVTKVGN